MPSRTQTELLRLALRDARASFRSLVVENRSAGATADEARSTLARLGALDGVPARRLVGDDLSAMYTAFLAAENWNTSLADSQGRKTPDGRESLLLARQLRRLRLRLWGESTDEVARAGATVVPMFAPKT